MSIISPAFAGFVLIVLALYYLLPRRPQNVLLLIASYVFYATWSWQFPSILAAITLVTFVLARRIQAAPDPARRRWLWIGILFNLFALGLFKYGDFFASHLSDGLRILLPIGLSFYVLQAISYLIDVSRRQLPAESDWVDFALYMAYFPRLLAGPIERARTFLPHLKTPRVVDNERLTHSVTLIVIGVARKVVFADTLAAMIPDEYFTAPGTITTVSLLTYAVAYAFWLYNDFAGYTGVVCGVSGLFGITLSPNFEQPYFARNLSEFWSRWHISLSHWLRDYIYFPLSRALIRRNPRRTNLLNIVLPPMVTMLASGLWHGTGWHMIIWGGLHGAYLVGERVYALWRPAGPAPQQPRWRQGAAMLIVFGLVVIAWIPFSMTLPNVVAFARQVAALEGLHRPSVRIIAVLVAALWLDWVQYRRADDLVFLRWPRLAQAALLALLALAVFLVTQATISPPFVYQGF